MMGGSIYQVGLHHLLPRYTVEPLPWSRYLQENLRALKSLAGNVADLTQLPHTTSGNMDPKCVTD